MITDAMVEVSGQALFDRINAANERWKDAGPNGRLVYQQDARAVLEAAEAVRWQPIATAPMDDTTVLVYVAPTDELPGFVTLAAYLPYATWCPDRIREVTHWQPRPEAPL